jgi:2-keto-4-pentenoate hydratase/2-oxohepta-3-ene-1,7-dioic acid hydratase in catechol pathway
LKVASISFAGEDILAFETSREEVISMPAALKARTGKDAPAWAYDMLLFIEAGSDALTAASEAMQAREAAPETVKAIPRDQIHWHPPVRRPSKICCLALNNSANSERIISGPPHPAIFVKGANALVGHEGAISIRKHYGRVHPEPELAVVIGRTAKDIEPAEAFDYIFGYTIHNDITSPKMRGEDTFHYRAIHPRNGNDAEIEYVETYVSYSGRYKGSDTFSPMGPWIATKDQVLHPHKLVVRCEHKGVRLMEDNTENLFHKIPDVLAFITRHMTLISGDIVSMGTALKRATNKSLAVQNVDLHSLGGPISVSIESIGTLTNHVAVS